MSKVKVIRYTIVKNAPYHPQSKGQVEIFNRILIARLLKLCEEWKENWDDHLPNIMCAYRFPINLR